MRHKSPGVGSNNMLQDAIADAGVDVASITNAAPATIGAVSFNLSTAIKYPPRYSVVLNGRAAECNLELCSDYNTCVVCSRCAGHLYSNSQPAWLNRKSRNMRRELRFDLRQPSVTSIGRGRSAAKRSGCGRSMSVDSTP